MKFVFGPFPSIFMHFAGIFWSFPVVVYLVCALCLFLLTLRLLTVVLNLFWVQYDWRRPQLVYLCRSHSWNLYSTPRWPTKLSPVLVVTSYLGFPEAIWDPLTISSMCSCGRKQRGQRELAECWVSSVCLLQRALNYRRLGFRPDCKTRARFELWEEQQEHSEPCEAW